MSKSILVDEYNKLNVKRKDKKIFYQQVDVSFLDILSESEVTVNAKDYKECLCKDSKHLNNYFVECNKCHGKGTILLNGHEVVCNVCFGEKVVRTHDCYVCNNEDKVLVDSFVKIKLNKSMKENDEIVLDYSDYTLYLKIHIWDYNDYVLKGNDIYKLRSVFYSKDDYKNKISKEIKTVVNKEYVKSNFKKKKQIVKLDGNGINGGDFYFIFENELENEKETVYTNVLIDDKGYVSRSDLINKNVVEAIKEVPLNDTSIYLDRSKDVVETEDYIIKLNFLDSKDYEKFDDGYAYILNLTKQDLEMDKKNILINNENINVTFKKNLKESVYIKVNGKVLLDKKGKKTDLMIKINPYFENVYKISIKKNSNAVYVEDYKYKDFRLVDSFKKSDYLDKHIKIKDEERVCIDNDLILIKRV